MRRECHRLEPTHAHARPKGSRLQIGYKAVLYKIKDCEIVDPRDSVGIE
jgi:hypothetical protein